MSGLLHDTVRATSSATARHSMGFQPSALATTFPSIRRNTNAGNCLSASCFERPEKHPGFVGSGSDHVVGTNARAGKLREHSTSGVQHPCTLVGVRVDDDGEQVERGEPLVQWSLLTL